MNAYEKIKPYLEIGTTVPITHETVALLIDAIKELEREKECITVPCDKCGCDPTTPQTKQLTDERLLELQAKYGIDSSVSEHSVRNFVNEILNNR
jgi:hypothetical protein